jgi:hypothetical protein
MPLLSRAACVGFTRAMAGDHGPVKFIWETKPMDWLTSKCAAAAPLLLRQRCFCCGEPATGAGASQRCRDTMNALE